MMQPEQFFELMIKELEVHTEMQPYYKFLGNKSSWHFRRNYFLERLRYIQKHIITNNPHQNAGISIWDCGCGYGTTCLFLAMNGIKTYGTTLEFYFETVQKRKEYWSKYGDVSLFTCTYENLFDQNPPSDSFDWIIVQDTLHHLEPIDDALKIFHKALRKNGKLLSIEENGNNLIQRIKLYKYRGNKRIITMWDEKLKKEILLGNENIRSLKNWQELFEKNNFSLPTSNIQYVRFYLPVHYRFSSPEKLLQKEKTIQSKPGLRREYFFFGLNFIAQKN